MEENWDSREVEKLIKPKLINDNGNYWVLSFMALIFFAF